MIDGTFKVGEIATLQKLSFPFVSLNGDDCEILTVLDKVSCVDIFGTPAFDMVYTINVHGKVFAALPRHLKKKPRPADQKDAEANKTVSWDDCAWKPEQVGA